jgi:hypothetical protein
MKKLMTMGLLAAFLVLCLSWTTIYSAQPASRTSVNVARIEQMNASAVQLLESREWIVYLVQVTEQKKITAGTDVLTFAEGKIQSKKLTALGYSRSNARLGTREDGVSGFETMQKNAAGDTTFIRATLDSGVLSGIMSIRPLKGDRTVYEFTSAISQPPIVAQPAAATKKK